MPQREREGEEVEPVPAEPEAEPAPTPQEIIRQTWGVLGLHPTSAQVRSGLRDIIALRADGFSLSEIGEGARYAADRGWIWSFAGVKFRLPQALNALTLKAAQATRNRGPGTGDRGPEDGEDHPSLPSPFSRLDASEASLHRELWEQVKERIEGRVKRQSFKTWFSPTFIADYDGGRVVLEVPSPFFLDWMEEHYTALIESAFEEVLGHPVEVGFQTSEGREGI